MDYSLSRRDFLTCAAACAACMALPVDAAAGLFSDSDIKGHIFEGDAPKELWKWSIEAFHYQKVGSDRVMCLVCPNACVLAPGDRSVCRSKVNLNGKLYSLAYGNPCSVHIDPVEKKPLYHFYPQTPVFSIAATGCNLRCLNCQNWEISQVRPEDVRFSELFPQQVVDETAKRDIPMIAYTYSEAITYYEYMYDTARLARQAGIRNALISNGYINPGPLAKLAEYLDAANINLKSFDDAIYRKLNGARLDPVLATFKQLHETPVWFEMTTLVVPGYVDKPDMIKRMCGWIVENLGPDYPLHFIRFHPQYKLDRLPPTPVKTLEACRDIALAEGIHYAYVGNVPGHPGNNTYCHACQKMIVDRRGFHIANFAIKDGKCSYCGATVPGHWGRVPA